MFKGSKRTISDKAFKVVKSSARDKDDRYYLSPGMYRAKMKKQFNIRGRYADELSEDFKAGDLLPMFFEAMELKVNIRIYCCREEEVVYEPQFKTFNFKHEIRDLKVLMMTKARWKKLIIDNVIPRLVKEHGEVKCKNMSASLRVCDNFEVEEEVLKYEKVKL